MAKFLDSNGLTHFWSKIKTLLAGKADSEHSHSNFAAEVTFEDGIRVKNGDNQVVITVHQNTDQLNVTGNLYTSGNLNVDGDIYNGGQRYADLFASLESLEPASCIAAIADAAVTPDEVPPVDISLLPVVSLSSSILSLIT